MKGYGDKRSYQEICDLFNATFNAREPISKSTIVRTVQRFIETGIVKIVRAIDLHLPPMMRRVQLFCNALLKRLIRLLKKFTENEVSQSSVTF